MTDTDTDTMPEPGTIEEARRIVGSHWVEAVLLGADDIIALARLAIAEHERAEALARRVAELEARTVRAEGAVGVLAGQVGRHGLTEAAAATEWAYGLLNGHCIHCDDGHNLCGDNTPFGTCRHCGRNGPAIHTPTVSKERAVAELEAANADD